jgi:hypothetical protein
MNRSTLVLILPDDPLTGLLIVSSLPGSPYPTTSPKSSTRPRQRVTMTRSCRDPATTVRKSAHDVSASLEPLRELR